jgi:hypothetical protein
LCRKDKHALSVGLHGVRVNGWEFVEVQDSTSGNRSSGK